MEWRYLRLGQCDFCPNENARIYTPVLEGIRSVVPPSFCMRCRAKYEAKHADDNLPAPPTEKGS